jgi:basic membrane protein A
MKKLLALLLAACMVLALCACSSTSTGTAAQDTTEAAETADTTEVEESAEAEAEETETTGIAPEDLLVGLVCVEDENSGYDYAHISGAQTAMEALGIPAENLILKVNVTEDESAYDACVDLAEQGCDIIITDSYGHQDFTLQAAQEYPDITFVAMTGDEAWNSGLNNLKNAFCHTYESRYVSGVVAGMKLAEMVENGELTDANYDDNGNIKLGYVGAYPYAEVVSGYTAFFLGVQSIVENVVMDVSFTNSWYDPIAEASAAEALIANGACIISQHADSTGAPSAVEALREAGNDVYCVGYNISMLSVAPTAALTSATNDWSVFYTYALGCMLNGEELATDWSEGYATGANAITELGESCAEGTAEKVAEVEAAIADGSLNVFDCSTFTVDGEHPTSFLALDTDGDWVGDTGEAIVDGIFYESNTDLRSAPYFSLNIDGITQLLN